MALQPGTPAPAFTLPDADGNPVSLQDFKGRPVVLYFYPKDDTPGCTAEACSFRDQFEDFKDLGAEVLGVSSDSGASHQAFAQKHRLPFKLLSDKGGVVRKQYGVGNTLGLIPGRVTFVIGPDGVIRHTFNSQINATKHVSEALRTLQAMIA